MAMFNLHLLMMNDNNLLKKRESEKHYTEGAGVRRINSAIVFAKVHIVMCFVQGRCESYFFSLLCYTLYNKLV